MRTVWAIAATPPDEKKFGRHPTQKPLALLERIITASTEDEAIIFDPFMGSGTTGVAALKLGRQFVGVHNNTEYCELAEKRLKAALG
jgi:site-specific DNA-methyltransferase (adenine-specific)